MVFTRLGIDCNTPIIIYLDSMCQCLGLRRLDNIHVFPTLPTRRPSQHRHAVMLDNLPPDTRTVFNSTAFYFVTHHHRENNVKACSHTLTDIESRRCNFCVKRLWHCASYQHEMIYNRTLVSLARYIADTAVIP